MSNRNKIEVGELAAAWAAMEPRLDQTFCDESPEISSDFNQSRDEKIVKDFSTTHNKNQQNLDIFEQGIAGIAPDVLDFIADSSPDLINGVLLSRYRILRLLGSGGMGDVYLAERADGQVNMQVALKILSTGLSNPLFLARFQRERQILAELNHPGIASLLDAGITEDGRPWFVLDYIQGESLIDYCKHHAVPIQERLRIFHKICDAIEYAHQCGVIHRDLKPGNILIETGTDNPEPIVLDFGIAAKREDESLTRTGQMLGTAFYSSPEQIKGDTSEIDLRSDIFSLGILLYELVDQRKPFNGNNITETSYQIIHLDTPSLRSSNIPKDLSSIIFKCLNKAPSERYQSVSELIADLQNYKQGRSVSAHPVGPAYKFKRWVRRRPFISTAIFLVTLLMAGLISANLWQSWSKNDFAAEQVLITQHFDQAVQEIESGAQLVYSRPLHNIEHALKGFEQKYIVLKQEATRVNPASLPFAFYALGRAALAMGHNQEALIFLKHAWDAGFRDSVLALRLGQAYMRNYNDAIQQLSLLSFSEAQTAALEKARQNYLQPAREFLQTGSSADHEYALIAKAQIQYLNNDTVSALKLLSDAVEKSPWPVDAMIESGNFYLEIAEKKLLEGDHSSARDALFSAEQTFRETVIIARSHPDAIKGWCIVVSKMIQLEQIKTVDENSHELKPIESCDSLTTLHPNSSEAFVQSGGAYLNVARNIRNHGDNPDQALQKASSLTALALQLDPLSSQALSLSGSIHITRSLWVYETGGDGSMAMTTAIEALDKSAVLTPGDNDLIEELAFALQRAGQMEYINGGNGDKTYSKSNELLRQLIALPETRISSLVLLSDSLTWQAYFQYKGGKDSEGLLQEAILAARQVLKISPNHVKASNKLAMALSTAAEFTFLKGEDPAKLSYQSFSQYQQIIDNNPENHTSRFNQLYPLSLAIDYSLDQRISQRKQLKKMHQLIIELQKKLHNAHETNLLWADYWRYKAKQKIVDQQDPGVYILASRAFLKKSLTSKIDRYEAVQSFAALTVFEHQWRTSVGKPNLTLYNDDYSKLSATIDEYPDLPVLRLWRARLMMLSSIVEKNKKIRVARQDLALALQKNPLMSNRTSTLFELTDAEQLY